MIRILFIILLIAGCANVPQFPVTGGGEPVKTPLVQSVGVESSRNSSRLQLYYSNMHTYPTVIAEGNKLYLQFEKNTRFSPQAAEVLTNYTHPCIYSGFYYTDILSVQLTCVGDLHVYPENINDSLDIILQTGQ